MKPLNFEKIKEKTYRQYDLHLMQIEEEAEKRGIEKGEKIGIAKALLETAKNMILGFLYKWRELLVYK